MTTLVYPMQFKFSLSHARFTDRKPSRTSQVKIARESLMTAPHEPTDETLLVDYVRSGNRHALDQIVERRWGEAYRICLGVLRDPGAAEDAAQEAFVSLVRSASQFEPGRSFGGWFYALVLNAARMHARSRGRRRRHEESAASQRPNASPGGEGERRLDAALVEEHLDRLPIETRFPIVLHYYEGHSHEDVALTLGVPKTTARARIRRGLEQLRESLVGAGSSASLATVEETLADFGIRRSTTHVPRAPRSEELERVAGRSRLGRVAPRRSVGGLVFGALAVASLGAMGALLAARKPVPGPRGIAAVSSTGRALSDPQSKALPTPDISPRRPEELGSAGSSDTGASAMGVPPAPAGTGTVAGVESEAVMNPFHALAVKGRVVTRDGRPVAGACVALRMELGHSQHKEKPKDRIELADGRWDVPPAERLARVVRRALLSDNHGAAETLELAVGESATDGSYRLVIPNTHFCGYDTLGEVLVAAESVSEHAVGIAEVPYDELWKLLENDVELNAGDLALRPVSHARIAVRRDNQPVSGATVKIQSERTIVHVDVDESRTTAFELKTDEQGVVELETDSRTLLVSAEAISASGGCDIAREDRHLVLHGPDASITIDLESTVAVSVEVVDRDGCPATHVGVCVRALELVEREGVLVPNPLVGSHIVLLCPPENRCNLTGLRRGTTYRVTGRSAEEESTPVYVTAPGTVTVRLDETPRGRLEVAARLAPTSEESRVSCELERLDPATGRFVYDSTLSLANGEGGKKLPAGTYRARVMADALAGALSAPVEVKAGEPAWVEVTLGLGRNVSGLVTDASGVPLEAEIRVPLRPRDTLPGRSGRDGHFEVALVPDGDTELTIGEDGFEEKTVRLRAGALAIEPVTLTPKQ